VIELWSDAIEACIDTYSILWASRLVASHLHLAYMKDIITLLQLGRVLLHGGVERTGL